MKKEIKRVKRERVYQGTIVDVYKDYMEFSNGNHEVWDYIHHKGAAAVIPVMDDGRLLMVRQYRNALDRFTLELPAGGLDQADEPGRDCSARELEEETGYHSDDLEWLLILAAYAVTDVIYNFCQEFALSVQLIILIPLLSISLIV